MPHKTRAGFCRQTKTLAIVPSVCNPTSDIRTTHVLRLQQDFPTEIFNSLMLAEANPQENQFFRSRLARRKQQIKHGTTFKCTLHI